MCAIWFVFGSVFVWQHDNIANTGVKLTKVDVTKISAEDLKIQVDELYENYNKLAEALNIVGDGGFEKLTVSFTLDKLSNRSGTIL